MKKCAYDTLPTIMSTKKIVHTLQNAPRSARKIKHTKLSIPTTTFLDANPFYHSWYHLCCHFPNMQYIEHILPQLSLQKKTNCLTNVLAVLSEGKSFEVTLLNVWFEKSYTFPGPKLSIIGCIKKGQYDKSPTSHALTTTICSMERWLQLPGCWLPQRRLIYERVTQQRMIYGFHKYKWFTEPFAFMSGSFLRQKPPLKWEQPRATYGQ